VGRHSLARKRRTSPLGLAAVAVPVGALFAAGGTVQQLADGGEAPDSVVVDDVAQRSVEVVAATPATSSASSLQVVASSAPAEVVSASRWRVMPRELPAGVAPERGLQVRTILAARSISAVFPEILDIGGVRADSLPWHPHGLALDVTIPNPSTEEGIALGNKIVAYVLENAERFGLQDAIWRGVYYTPNGAQGTGYGHYDHVHITTTGGGYPSGGETYLR
jgi:hypothetical protein